MEISGDALDNVAGQGATETFALVRASSTNGRDYTLFCSQNTS
jgi:hypothetical protein